MGAKPSPAWPTEADVERAKIEALRGRGLSDTDRVDALITLFGGYYAFPVMWQVSELFQNGRSGLDAFLSANPSLLSKSSEGA